MNNQISPVASLLELTKLTMMLEQDESAAFAETHLDEHETHFYAERFRFKSGKQSIWYHVVYSGRHLQGNWGTMSAYLAKQAVRH